MLVSVGSNDVRYDTPFLGCLSAIGVGNARLSIGVLGMDFSVYRWIFDNSVWKDVLYLSGAYKKDLKM